MLKAGEKRKSSADFASVQNGQITAACDRGANSEPRKPDLRTLPEGGFLQSKLSKRAAYVSGLIRFGAIPLAIAGALAINLPSRAITASYQNSFRACAGRLNSAGIAADAAASACAGALRPGDLSKCVAEIKQQTKIPAADALTTCRQVRRPNELANCVIGISRDSEKDTVPGVLDYCGRSLLPERFAECVVGLSREVKLAPTQAMETCISANDRLSEFNPNFLPPNQTPVQPAPTPPVPQNPPLVVPPATSPAQPTPAPTAPPR